MITLEPCFKGNWDIDKLSEVISERKSHETETAILSSIEKYLELAQRVSCAVTDITCNFCNRYAWVIRMRELGIYRPLSHLEKTRHGYSYKDTCPHLLESGPMKDELAAYTGDYVELKKFAEYERHHQVWLAKDRISLILAYYGEENDV